MFTGIIHGTAKIVFIEKKKNMNTYEINLSRNLSKNLKIGDSVSHNGCCLTVKLIRNFNAIFDIIQETLNNTNLGTLKIGDYVNIERSVKYGDEIGGHIISGHIMSTAQVSKVEILDNSRILWLKIKKKFLMKYIFYKGFICVDGISLTIGSIINNKFSIHLIPETLFRTTISHKKRGDIMNVEIDLNTQIIVDTAERIITQISKN
ncbi:riboflavin synthase subunit alpha [Buchnera aphidicola (Muscaphis stroyani)]|uniref:Riboflavin synthase n=1 Tax=Buchnera aphidicola (Muscaphis stroyani) TaxID=1241869 RepID=A0A4D6YIG8_9GAMM|nr:riboflavin synthase subunit alpha [Buchnera aphidicola]QCI24215.1 riboflavin synthase subunit alpha [Buchnera aphidicola (Muscaphis stroyani)]